MKVLITGATGYIGKQLTNHILSHTQHEIALLVRDTNKLENIDENITKVISTQTEYWEHDVAAFCPDTVLHLATKFLSSHKASDIEDLINSNITFGTKLLEALKDCHIKSFINTSTYAVYATNDHYLPQNLYAATKKSFEDILKFYSNAYEMKVVNLHLYDTYGTGDTRPKLINLLVNAFKKEEPLNMSEGLQDICYTNIKDTVRAFITCFETPPNEIWTNYSVHASEHMNLRDLVKIVEEVTNKKVDINFGYYPYRKFEVMKFHAKFPTPHNWQPQVSIREGIQELLNE